MNSLYSRILIIGFGVSLVVVAGFACIELLFPYKEEPDATNKNASVPTFAATTYLNFRDTGAVPYHSKGFAMLVSDSTLKTFQATGLQLSSGIYKSEQLVDSSSTKKGLFLTALQLQPSDVAKIIHQQPVGLDMSGSMVNDESLRELQKLDSVQILHMMSCPRLTPSGLSSLRNMKRLRTLAISGNGLTDEALKAVSGIKGLRNLYAALNRFTDDGLSTLKELPLSFVDFSNTAVTGRGLEGVLAGKHLDAMVLSHMFFTDDDLEAISHIDVDRLSLSHCQLITDVGVRHLCSMKQLKRLDLSGCPRITRTGHHLLQTQLPGCALREIFDPM